MEMKEWGPGVQLSCVIMGSVELLCIGGSVDREGLRFQEDGGFSLSHLSHMPGPRSAAQVEMPPSSLQTEDDSSGSASLSGGSRVTPEPLGGLS